MKPKTKALNWDETIKPYIAMANERRGFMARVVDEMNMESGRKWARQQVRAYLTENGNEPGVRTAMLLLSCCEEVERQMQKEVVK